MDSSVLKIQVPFCESTERYPALLVKSNSLNNKDDLI